MAGKYHSDTKERTDAIIYSPGLQNSGDLESSTKNITVTSKPGTPDYGANLTTIDVPDARLKVKRLCQRLLVHIDSFGGVPAATKLYYSLEVNGVERASGEFTTAGADNPVSWDLTEGQFNLGVNNSIQVFLWVDQGNAVVSLVQLWQAVGTCTTGWSAFPLEIEHSGLAQVSANFTRVGSGSPSCHLISLGTSSSMSESLQSDISSRISIFYNNPAIRLKGTAVTDMNYISVFNAGLISSI
jgi:hypothetical protein